VIDELPFFQPLFQTCPLLSRYAARGEKQVDVSLKVSIRQQHLLLLLHSLRSQIANFAILPLKWQADVREAAAEMTFLHGGRLAGGR